MYTVDKLILLAEQQARNVLLVMRQTLLPTWVIIDAKGQPHVHATPWESDRDKRLAELAMKLEMRVCKARAYSFLTEAWAAKAPEGWDPNTPLPEKDRAMNQVDRLEIVLAFATDGTRSEWRRWNIRRDWDEQVIGLEAVRGEDFGEPEGWMAEMLK